jgi:hypothetical protein
LHHGNTQAEVPNDIHRSLPTPSRVCFRDTLRSRISTVTEFASLHASITELLTCVVPNRCNIQPIRVCAQATWHIIHNPGTDPIFHRTTFDAKAFDMCSSLCVMILSGQALKLSGKLVSPTMSRSADCCDIFRTADDKKATCNQVLSLGSNKPHPQLSATCINNS